MNITQAAGLVTPIIVTPIITTSESQNTYNVESQQSNQPPYTNETDTAKLTSGNAEVDKQLEAMQETHKDTPTSASLNETNVDASEPVSQGEKGKKSVVKSEYTAGRRRSTKVVDYSEELEEFIDVSPSRKKVRIVPKRNKIIPRSKRKESFIKPQLNKHKKKDARKEPLPQTYRCDRCDQEFAMIRDLKDHYASHDEEKPFICTVCDEAFNRMSCLKSHIRTHTQEKPHKCSICDASFKMPSNLRQHLQTTHGVLGEDEPQHIELQTLEPAPPPPPQQMQLHPQDNRPLLPQIPPPPQQLQPVSQDSTHYLNTCHMQQTQNNNIFSLTPVQPMAPPHHTTQLQPTQYLSSCMMQQGHQPHYTQYTNFNYANTMTLEPNNCISYMPQPVTEAAPMPQQSNPSPTPKPPKKKKPKVPRPKVDKEEREKQVREEKSARERQLHPIQEPCICKKSCRTKLPQDRREAIWRAYWDMEHDNRRFWLFASISRMPKHKTTKRPKHLEESGKPRKNRTMTYVYYLKDAKGYPVEVCRHFFLTTLGYHPKNDAALTTMMSKTPLSSVLPPKYTDRRGRHPPANKKDRTVMRSHIESFVTMVKQRAGNQCPIRFVRNDVTVRTMYQDFISKNPDKCSYDTYRKVMAEMNVYVTATNKPRKKSP